MKRHVWKAREVSASQMPELNVRTYLEQRSIRQFLNKIVQEMPIRTAADIGCGYGRLTMVLGEYAKEVFGYEREIKLAKIAAALLPDVQIGMTKTLANLPCVGKIFDFAMFFTVLSHMDGKDAQGALLELNRIMKPKSYVLLAEQTDHSRRWISRRDSRLFTHGRSIQTYEQWMPSFKLVEVQKRIVEPTRCPKSAGEYMLFSRC